MSVVPKFAKFENLTKLRSTLHKEGFCVFPVRFDAFPIRDVFVRMKSLLSGATSQLNLTAESMAALLGGEE